MRKLIISTILMLAFTSGMAFNAQQQKIVEMIGKVITAIGTIMTVFSKLGAVIGVVKGTFAALSAVMLANPIGLIIEIGRASCRERV